LENPVEHVEPVKHASNARRRPFTVPEIRAVLAVADPEWQSLIKFGLYCGQRLGDLALLTWSNIDLARDKLRLVTRKTGKRLTGCANGTPTKVGASVGTRKGCRRRLVCFHSLRRTAVTLLKLKEAGIPQAVVQELIGHESEQISANYTHVGTEALRKAAAAFPKLV
jgi:integrase